MKIYPKLETLLNNLAYCAITEDGFVDICAAAGVDWSWPKTFAGDTVLEYQNLVSNMGRERAIAQMRPTLSMLERQIQNLSQLPNGIESIRSEIQGLSKIQRAMDYANMILQDPEGYEKYQNLIEDAAAKSAVATTDFEGLLVNYELAREKILVGQGKIAIPGFEKISELIGGFNPGRVTFLLAETGFGKSNLAMNLAFAAANQMAVGYLNLEMSYEDISKRAAVMLSGKTWRELYGGGIELNDMDQKPKYEIRISDGSELHVETIIAWARAFKRENPDFGLLVIDYDQKMLYRTSRDAQEWHSVHLAIRALEDEAKKLNLHTLVVAQINRAKEISSSHRALFTAHSVLTFRPYQGRPVVENSLKSRHAAHPRGVYVIYDDSSCRVRESFEDIFTLRDEADIASEAKTTAKKSVVARFQQTMNRSGANQ